VVACASTEKGFKQVRIRQISVFDLRSDCSSRLGKVFSPKCNIQLALSRDTCFLPSTSLTGPTLPCMPLEE
jgi:hypothetical protein